MPGTMLGATVDGHVEDADRRAALRTLARGFGVLVGGCLGGIGPDLPAAVASTGRADVALDIQLLQTASSMETLLIDLYATALGTGPLGKNAAPAVAIAAMTDIAARDTLVKLLTETQAHHREHRLAFQALTTALGGQEQNEANPKYASGVTGADVSDPLRLVDYAAVLEKIVTDTYVFDLTLAENVKAKEALAAVMAVEAQHLAVFRVVGALLRDDLSRLVRIPLGNDLVDVPATLAGIAFPEAMDDVTSSSSVAEPESGAVAVAVEETIPPPPSDGATTSTSSSTTSSTVAPES